MAGEHKSSHPFSFGVDRLGLVALKAPVVSSILILLISALAVLGLLRLKVDDSLAELFRTNSEEFRIYEDIDRRFPSSEYDVLVVVEGKSLLTRDGQTAFPVATSELQLADGVSGLVSMLSARGKPDANGYDKANVRNGTYDLWSPLHFVRRKGAGDEKAATRVLDLVLMDPTVTVEGVSRADVFTTWVTRSFVPECAMEWERDGEMRPLKPHETSSCKNAFECTLHVNGPGACARCDDQSSTCPGGSHCDFRFGYCEDN